MDLYSVGAGTSVGNELSKNARDLNSFRIQQNAMMVEHAATTLANDKQSKRDDTEFKVGMDSFGGAEAIGGAIAQYNKGLGQMITETAGNFRTAGNKIAQLGGKAQATISEVRAAREGASVEGGLSEAAQSSFLQQSSRVLSGAETGADDVSKGLSLAKNLTADVGEGSRFGGLSEAGGVGRFLANRAGFTSELGVELGGKAIGAAGGIISGGQDITNLIETGHVFKKGESALSEAGNIGSMVGAALDMASIAVPVLAPLALATNMFSAVASTIGTEQDDKKQISTDSAPPPTQALAVHPAWSSVGMVASVHSQPRIV